MRCKAGSTVLVAVLLWSSPLDAQTALPGTEHVRWPLADIVMLPDSGGIWFLAAPTPGTTQWKSGSNLVSLCVDPVPLLQWATVARKLTAGEISATPKLRGNNRNRFIMLGKNPRTTSAKQKFVFVAVDSGSSTQWMTYASQAQVDTLLGTVERAAEAGRETFDAAAEPDPDTPVSVLHIPRPSYPGALASSGRVGRVWMQYVVGPDGRPQEGSFRALLTDDPRFTNAAIHALRRGQFKPAVRNGQPVSHRVFQVINFRMRD